MNGRLTKKQYEVLKSLEYVEYKVIGKNPPEIYVFLASEGLVQNGYDNSQPNRPYTSRLTEKGRACISEYEWENKTYYEPLEISKKALFLSRVSIVVASLAMLSALIPLLMQLKS